MRMYMYVCMHIYMYIYTYISELGAKRDGPYLNGW